MDEGALFDPQWRARGDADFVLQLIEKGTRFAHIPEFLSVFFITGANLGKSDVAVEEYARPRGKVTWVGRLRIRALNAMRHLEKLAEGAYRTDFPLRYAIYEEGKDARAERVAESGRARV